MAMIVLLAWSCGNGRGDPKMQPADSSVTKICVYQDGRITQDGLPVSPDDLQDIFGGVRDRGGVVCYLPGGRRDRAAS
jgi:hypothetical protein